MTAPTRTSVTVEVQIAVPVEHAFAVFTENFDAVKPHEHNMLDVPIEKTELQPWAGGTIRDIGIDGSVCTWARVLEVDPPHRILFTWDISPEWKLETDLAQTSEVEVRFAGDGRGGTLVTLEHRHLDRHRPGWESFLRLEGGDGWGLYLTRLKQAAER
jgi:uncharacterized protein YndB with AHSA1/START domain